MFPKGEKPRQYPKTCRPITLLDVLYKLISGSLSYRILPIIDYVVLETRSGFIKGRYIGENTGSVHDFMSFTESSNTTVLLVLINFGKAFNFVSWIFIFNVFNYFGFGNYVNT